MPSYRISAQLSGIGMGRIELPGFDYAFTVDLIPTLIGNPGPAGPGVPVGGTTGQVLTKTSGADYATAWQTVSGGGSAAWGGITGTLSAQTDLQTALDGKAATSHTHTASQISDSTAAGRAILTAADATAQRSALGLVIGTNVQAQDAELSAIAGLVSAADRLPYFTGSGAAALATFTAAGRALVDDADAAAQRTTLGLAAVASSGSASDLGAGTLPAARFDDTAHGTRAGGTLHAAATTSVAGFMSSADKTKLDGVATGATANATDPALRARASHTGDDLTGAFGIADSTDQTKRVAFDASNITTGTTRTLTLPNNSGQILITAGAQTVSGVKTFSVPPVLATPTTAQASVNLPHGTAPTTPANGDMWTTTGGVFARVNGATVQLDAAGGGATDLGYTASTRLLTSSTGADVTLPLVTSTDAGLAPASGGGTTNFLRADGTWAAPAGGGGVSDGDKGDVVVSGSGTVWTVESAAGNFSVGGSITLPSVSTPSLPSAGNVKLFGRSVAGRMLPAIIGPSGIDTALQAALSTNRISIFAPNGNANTVTTLGGAYTGAGTATTANVATTNRFTRMRGVEYLVTTAATTAVAGLRATANQWTVGAATAGDGGFFSVFRWGPATGVSVATSRAFCGMRSATTPSDVEPSSLTSIVGMGWDAADANIQMMHNDGSGTATKINLGASFPVPTVDRTSVYEIALFSPPGTTQSVGYRVTDLVSGAEASGTITTDLPSTTTLIAPHLYLSVGGTSSVVGVKVFSQYIETDY